MYYTYTNTYTNTYIHSYIHSVYYPDVLIVDDSLVTLKITGLTLEKDGHTVERAKNGQVCVCCMLCAVCVYVYVYVCV
jgi:hypothetical protein